MIDVKEDKKAQRFSDKRISSKKVPTIKKSLNKLIHKYKDNEDVNINHGVLSVNILVPMEINIPIDYIESTNQDTLKEIKDRVKQFETDYKYYTSMERKVANIEKESPVPENQYKYFQQLLSPSTNFYRKNIALESSKIMLNPFTALKKYQDKNGSFSDRKFTVAESLFITYWISKGMPQIVDLDDVMSELNKSQSTIASIVFNINQKLKLILRQDLKVDINNDIIFLSGSTNPLNKLPISITNTYKGSYFKRHSENESESESESENENEGQVEKRE